MNNLFYVDRIHEFLNARVSLQNLPQSFISMLQRHLIHKM